jgi:NTP-dependent ternary conflict system VMAP-like protein/effector-associated domain 2 (EAD2)-containing protein
VVTVDAVRRQIEHDFVDTLEQCPRMRDESSRDLLVGNIGSRLGKELNLHKQSTTRTSIIELINVCVRLERGLELLTEEVAYLDPAAPEIPELLCLCEEWQVAGTYGDDMWPELKSTMHSVKLTAGDERDELVMLRQLAATATGPRTELPKHCSNLWHVFIHLAGANAMPDALPPCMILVDGVARVANDPALARALRKWNRSWAERWQQTDLLDAAVWRTREDQQDPRNVHLIILIEPNPIEPSQVLVKHWRQWDPNGWRPQRGTDKLVRFAALEAEVDSLIADMETTLGASTDASRTGEIWLEFVLPAELLNLPVQLWSKKPLPDDTVALALHHPVMVRSLERLRTPRLHLAWRQRWAHLTAGQLRPYWSQPSGDDYFTRLHAELSYDKRIMSLVLSQPPDPGNDTAHREINAALQAGIPAIIWHQVDCSLPEFRDAVSTLVADGALVHLPQRIATLRRDALRRLGATHGKNVALLWDDPDRLPEPPPRGIG